MTDPVDPEQAALEAQAATRLANRIAEERRQRWMVPAAAVLGVAGGLVIGQDLSSPIVGAVGGVAALLVVLILASDYFWTPRPGSEIRAPNRYVRIAAGILAIGSALAWILDSLFN